MFPIECDQDSAGLAGCAGDGDHKGNLTRVQIDWQYFQDTKLLHLSGLSVPKSPSIGEIMLEAATWAKAKGIAISFDMNCGSRIWSPVCFTADCSVIFSKAIVLVHWLRRYA